MRDMKLKEDMNSKRGMKLKDKKGPCKNLQRPLFHFARHGRISCPIFPLWTKKYTGPHFLHMIY